MRYGTRAGVHVQMGITYRNSNFEPVDICYIGIVWDDPPYARDADDNAGIADDSLLSVPEGYPVQVVPGTMAFGQITNDYVTGNDYDSDKLKPSTLRKFACFTVLFDASGSVVTTPVSFKTTHPVFKHASNKETAVWDPDEIPSPHNSVSVVTLFDYRKASMYSNPANFLNEYGQFLPVNVTTGLLHPRR
jgi:hypothetical protein